MIGKTHIITFSVIAVMYLVVGIWKYIPRNSETDNEITVQQATEREEILQFWETYNTATSFRARRDYEQAVIYYTRSLEINGSHEDALYYLASMHLFLKNFEETEEQLLKLEQLQPNAPRTHLQLGTLYFCMDTDNNYYNLQESKKRFETAWNLNREETGTPLMLSKIYILQSEYDNAEPLLNIVTNANKMSYQALFLDGYLNWIKGLEKQARDKLINAMNLYQSLTYAEVHGEGATEAGARAMLSEDRYCDTFESVIEYMLSGQNSAPALSAFETFGVQLSSWRTLYQQ